MKTIFQSSDLAQRRVEFLDAARSGVARLRDKDGTSLVMLPEAHLLWLQAIARWSALHLRLEDLIRRGVMPGVRDLGDLAWLRMFDMEDLAAFMDELHEALVIANAEESSAPLDECIKAWRVTAKQLEDPLRRSVLLGEHSPDDFEEVGAPAGASVGDEPAPEQAEGDRV